MKLFSLALTAALLASAGAVHAEKIPDAIHAYGLNGSYADELGGPALVPLGGSLTANRYKLQPAQGLVLTGAVPAEQYSIEIQFAPTNVDGRRRILEFKNQDSDLGLFIVDGALWFYYLGGSWNPTITPGKLNDIVITRDAATKLVKMYSNGVFQAEFYDAGEGTAADFARNSEGQTVAYFLKDRLLDNTGGSINHIRIFDRVLTDSQIASLAVGKRPGNVTTK